MGVYYYPYSKHQENFRSRGIPPFFIMCDGHRSCAINIMALCVFHYIEVFYSPISPHENHPQFTVFHPALIILQFEGIEIFILHDHEIFIQH